ncbi:unnamed protein product [Rotaria magnacalcarata]|uniref:G-protein coupled receptors family 1 profile domain-containing protein n=1 Tax=Rotaria magnacalcarata TaxID=392030 RepID=A0A815XJI7_9BILA|nr:unnamed protein product [Rotaria magnacalcarata]CAF2058502.1 unnamed protein product [Rotaria magnacalcarata]CAF3939641.1 unnamed protein product [Rotaria magnacalcarata]
MTKNDSVPIGFDEFVKLTNIAHWIYRIWTIAFILVGFTGNFTALIIFIRWANRLSVYIYFSFLCIINILILLIDMNYHFLLPFILDNKILVKNLLPITCKFIFFLTYLFRYLFIWTIVMINIDRFVYLNEHPFKKKFCQHRTAKMMCFVLILLSISANGHFLIYFNQPVITEVPLDNTCFLDGLTCHCKSLNTAYRSFWKNIWPIYNLMIFGIIPLVIMIICCILIIRNIYLTRRRIFDGRRNSDASVNSENDNLRSIIKTLIWLDLLFPITIFPLLFLQIYVNYQSPKHCEKIGIMNLVFSILFAMIYIKNTFAFFIFYFTGQKFRRAFSKLIHCRNTFDYAESR